MFTLKIKFYKNGHLLEGFIHKNRHGEYYPNKNMSYQFDSLIDALSVRDAVDEKYGLMECQVINTDTSSEVKFSDGRMTSLSTLEYLVKEIIQFSGVKLSNFNIRSITRCMIEIQWNEAHLSIYPNKIEFRSDSIDWSPLTLNKHAISYTNEMIMLISELAWCYMSETSIQHILDKFNIDISQAAKYNVEIVHD